VISPGRAIQQTLKRRSTVVAVSIPWAYIGLSLFVVLAVAGVAVHDMPASGVFGLLACGSLLLLELD
jgi:hypothetical protein